MADKSLASEWSLDNFIECYNSIKYQGSSSPQILSLLRNDLFEVLNVPGKNEQSRNKLIDESSNVKFTSGEEFKLNKKFRENALSLSTELNLDELVCAEILYYSTDLAYEKGTGFLDSARLAFFSRYEYILSILGYIISNGQFELILEGKSSDKFFQNLLLSFEKIYQILNNLNDLIDKQKVTYNINDLTFINTISYIKSSLFHCHETLGEVYFTLIDNLFPQFGSLKYYNRMIEHINKNIDEADVFIIHYLPGLLRVSTSLSELPEPDVIQLHAQVTKKLIEDHKLVMKSDYVDLTKTSFKGYELVINLVFLTVFIPWCKKSDHRIQKFDFKQDILKYIEVCISYGASEILLSISAETTKFETAKRLEWSNLYDFRSLLQINYPAFSPRKLIYSNADDISNILQHRPKEFENTKRLLDTTNYKVSESFCDNLVAPFFHEFFSAFIGNAAIILTSLRDSEEDFLLSSIDKNQSEKEEKIGNDKFGSSDKADITYIDEQSYYEKGIDLDQIASRADIERFYLSFVYTYDNRPELCSLFWSNDDLTNDIVGFISWGISNNTSPLITATFCLLLGSLASNGSEGSIRIWGILVNNNATGVSGKSDFSRISIDSIMDSLVYYHDALSENFENDLNLQEKLQQKRQEFMFSSAYSGVDTHNNSTESNQNKIMIELSEDSVVFISGFFSIISAIVKNLSVETERSRDIKQILFARIMPIVSSFLKFDNIISKVKTFHGNSNVPTTSNHNKSFDHPQVIVNEDNRVILINLIMRLLADFVANDENLYFRNQIWELIDRWVCLALVENESNMADYSYLHSAHGPHGVGYQSKLKFHNGSVKMKTGFQINMTHFSVVANFCDLMKHLFSPLSNDSNTAFSSYKLLYPATLGREYRASHQIGIWPYFEYLLLEIFGNSNSIASEKDKFLLQTCLAEIMENSLKEVDWIFLHDLAPKIIHDIKGLENIEDSSGMKLTYRDFMKLHHSLSVLNYLFDEKAYSILFAIISTGNEAIHENIILSKLVEKCLNILHNILLLQETFITKLLPILKNEENNNSSQLALSADSNRSVVLKDSLSAFNNIYYPKSLGTNAVSDFYEICLFNLPTIVQLGLYAGSSDLVIANLSVIILTQISNSSEFISTGSQKGNDLLLNRNRLLTIFESVDESFKVQYGFIQQLERSIDHFTDVEVKFNILRFLSDNLSNSLKEPGISHFLLGFQIRGNNLILDENNNSNTLLKSLIYCLCTSIDCISSIDYNDGNVRIIDMIPAKLCYMILDILIKLCRDPISSRITLKYLRKHAMSSLDLFSKLVSAQPKIDPISIWSNIKFDGNLRSDTENKFIEDQLSPETLISFIKHRNLLLQYLSLELHDISQQRSITKKEHYTKLLLNGNEVLEGSPQILNFLDILNFKFSNLETYNYHRFNEKYNLSLIVEKMEKEGEKNNKILDTSVLEKIYKLSCKSVSPELQTKEQKDTFASHVMNEGIQIADFLGKYIIAKETRNAQVSCLHSWTQLIQVLVSEGEVNSSRKMDFILEVFQIILPKINEYLEEDVQFSKEFISLCVFLFDFYERGSFEERKKGHKNDLYIERLISLFETCLNGILCSNSTSDLRSDLYVLASKFLHKSFTNENLLKRLSSILRLVDVKLIDIITNDSICAEGTPRITSLLFLETLVHLSSNIKSSFVLDLMIKNNTLALLVSSIKRTDELVLIYGDPKAPKEGIETLLYELTAFKCTLCLLIRVAQTRMGSLHLIQSEIFAIIKHCKFLSVDPDIGLSIKINNPNNELININLSLDTPISIMDTNHFVKEDNEISLFEFLVPMFQLVCAILLSMGPSYKPSIQQAKELFEHFKGLIVGVMKRDTLIEEKQINSKVYAETNVSYVGLKEMVSLIVLLESLTRQDSK
ncbi:Piso0_003655 [Millerozyma farinosa CBS 7064]|uniref:Piso0_003655 protein n=1 Tax=Pichia sorbitophila (strain ATCC MYA-4447 / BCRC 22081 / CBS 7064 / NBRC 10061 / NRRL Y-12695) TaxID=559304 RepID=G8YGI4_PICSO|nr:Piso0_003655 [Millerozyma farinosa CBS 7064]CCE81301.1 Piso0_003655 [Millerozyma farinosa CBS 7064]